eukprot:CAMPEP_0203683582 /NCGR_PEP_ID=MMETSP0090-20130426/47594_1 /ASSEMBLY_ACC=CAM_ASM_001088 /TAXON_ID=426623 /ORGANISM="Chaetoceros affinis, Strain CCMP159" /LENGTH=506 /DNA_ID=CAMNT_0050552731 /DNA_START=105 /DNA_END=1625 /DNA_ORIENTATION=+
MAFESLKLNGSRRASTFEWLSKGQESHINHEMMIETFEKCYNRQAADIDLTQKPVNVLCFDGGGLKVYGLLKMVEAVQEKCKEKGDFCQQFDLIGGTSVGGVTALLNNVFDSTEDAIAEAFDVIDECREKTFSKINYLNVLLQGKAVGNDDDSLLKIFKDRFGSEKPLFNPDGIPCFVLSSSRRNDGSGSTNKCKEGDFYEPFIFRTYDYPEKHDDSVAMYSRLDLELAESSSSISLHEAMAATSAVPGLVDRVSINVDGVERRFADGNVFANNPIVIALNEAKRLYPTRPLGLVMSFGLATAENDLVNRAIDICRLSHPNLHYQRICPKHIFDTMSVQETDLAKLAVIQKETFDYVMNDAAVNRLLDVSLEKLFAHKPQWQEGTSTVENGQEEEDCQRNKRLPLFLSTLFGCRYNCAVTNIENNGDLSQRNTLSFLSTTVHKDDPEDKRHCQEANNKMAYSLKATKEEKVELPSLLISSTNTSSRSLSSRSLCSKSNGILFDGSD